MDTNLINMDNLTEFLNSTKSALIICSRPLDLDCISSGLLMKKFLEGLDKEVTIIHPAKFKKQDKDFYSFLPFFDEIKDQDLRPYLKNQQFDLLVFVDGMNLNQFLDDKSEDKSIPDLTLYPKRIHIDHHSSNTGELGTLTFYDPNVSSTTEIVLDKIFPQDKLTPELATLGYAGIVGDTGNFMWKMSPEVFRIAATLLEHQADADLILDKLYFNKSKDYFESLKFALEHTEYFADLGTTLLCISHKLITQNNLTEVRIDEIKRAYADDISKVITDYPRGFILTEKDPGVVTISGRGNTIRNKLSLPEIFSKLGGTSGGHFNAAGARVEGDFETNKQNLLNAIRSMI